MRDEQMLSEEVAFGTYEVSDEALEDTASSKRTPGVYTSSAAQPFCVDC